MTPNFEFSFGKPADDQAGRWIEGSVTGHKAGYHFTARLMRGHISTTLQCHPVSIDAARPFRGEDFAAFLRMISRGRFTTTTRLLDLDFPDGLDPAIVGAIWDAMMVWVDPWDQNCPDLLQDLTSLGDQLEQVRKKELLCQAFAHFSKGSRSGIIVGEINAGQDRSRSAEPKGQLIEIPIACLTVLVKEECLNGDKLKPETGSENPRPLASFVFLSNGDIESCLADLTGRGLVVGKHIGVADMMHGAIIACEGIQYRRGGDEFMPQWVAFRTDG